MKDINMSQLSKIVVTIVVVLLFFLLFGAIVGMRGDAGHSTPGIFGLIVFAGLIGALRAIWKKPKDENKKDDNNSSILQK